MTATKDIKISPENLLQWSGMEDWDSGASAAPTDHTLSGAGATIARESTIVKSGTYSAAVTRAGADASLYYDLPQYADYVGRKMTFGCWVYATVASRARIALGDNVGTTQSSLHSGAAGWEYLTVTRNIDPSATRIRVEMQVNTGNTTAYFDGGILCEGAYTFTTFSDVSDVGQWSVANQYKGQEFKVTRRVGIRLPIMQIESKTIQFKGVVANENVVTARTNENTLTQALNSFVTKANTDLEPRDLYLFDDRFFRGYVTSFDFEFKGALRFREFSMRFKIPEPFEMSINKTRSKQTISTTPTTYTITNGGNAFTRPVILVTNNSTTISSLTFENLTTGQVWAYTGSIVTSQSLEVDTDLLTVENNGVDDVANFTGDMDMILAPGDNEVRITGLTSGIVKTDYFNRWL